MARVKPPEGWVTLSSAADQLATTKARIEQFANDTGKQISEHKPVDTVYQIIRESDLSGFDRWAQNHGSRRLSAIRDEPVQADGWKTYKSDGLKIEYRIREGSVELRATAPQERIQTALRAIGLELTDGELIDVKPQSIHFDKHRAKGTDGPLYSNLSVDQKIKYLKTAHQSLAKPIDALVSLDPQMRDVIVYILGEEPTGATMQVLRDLYEVAVDLHKYDIDLRSNFCETVIKLPKTKDGVYHRNLINDARKFSEIPVEQRDSKESDFQEKLRRYRTEPEKASLS